MNMKKLIALLLVFALLLAVPGAVVATETDAPAETEAAETTQTAQPAEGTEGTTTTPTGPVPEEVVEAYKAEMKAKTPDNTTIGSEFELVAENEYLALYVIMTNDDFRIGEFCVLDKRTGFVWRSNPIDANDDEIARAAGASYHHNKSQILVSYAKGFTIKTINGYTDIVQKNNVKIEKIDGGVKLTYTFKEALNAANEFEVDENNPATGFVIPVVYKLEDDAFSAEVLIQEMIDNYTIKGVVSSGVFTGMSTVPQSIDINITEITLLPAFGAAGLNEDGYLFIPDGSGAIAYFNNGKTNVKQPFTAPVYGRYVESKVETYLEAPDNFKLPVFGIVRSGAQGANAVMGVITDNAEVGYIHAEISGQRSAYNKTYSSYLNKIIEGSMVPGVAAQPATSQLADPNENYKVKYFMLAGEDATYAGMATRYREYLVEEAGMQKSEDLNSGALYLDMYAGVERQTSILGIPRKVFDVKTTYEDLRVLVDDLATEGIDNLVIKYSDWLKMSSRKKVQSKVKFEGSLGGRREFNKTVEYLDEKNVDFYPNVDFINYGESGNGFSRFFDSVKYPDQSPAYQRSRLATHVNLGFRWTLLKADKVEEAAANFLKKYENTGTADISLESIGTMVYSDGAHDGISRGEAATIWDNVIGTFKDAGGRVMVSEPNAYAIPKADVLFNVPSPTTYVQIADEAVPFYQIAMRGYKAYSSEPVNLSSEVNKTILQAIETGSGMTWSFVMRDTDTLKETYLNYLYSCNYGLWREELVEAYNDYKSVMDLVGDSEITNHEKIEDGVYRTAYKNGVSVYVNYNDYDVVIHNGDVVPAMGHIQFVGGER